MKHYCTELQNRLGEQGIALLSADPGAEEHVGECEGCYSFLGGLERLDLLLKDLREEPVAAELCSRVLESVAAAAPAPSAEKGNARKKRTAALHAAAHWCNRARHYRTWSNKAFFNRTFLNRGLFNREWLYRVMAWKRALAACSIAALVLILVVHGPKRQRVIKAVSSSTPGMGSQDSYGDLIVAFRNDIEAGKQERKEMYDLQFRTAQDLKEHKERVTGIFETFVDKFEQLAREVDALAGALRAQQDQIPLPNARELEGPDELEPLGFDTPTAAPPPPEPEEEPAALPVVAVPPSEEDSMLNLVPQAEHKKQAAAPQQKQSLDEEKLLGALRDQLQHAKETAGTAPTVIERTTPRELKFYVTPGEPTQIVFPAQISGGFKRKHSALAMERQGRFIIVFAQPEIPYEGEAILMHLEDGRSFAIRILPSDDTHPREAVVNVDESAASFGSYFKDGIEELPVLPPAAPRNKAQTLLLPLDWGKAGDPLDWFSKQRSTIEGLSFKQPRGYWQNTYLPGSPTVRRLQTALLDLNPSDSVKLGDTLHRAHEKAVPPLQPFDAPHGAALALFAHSDHPALDGKGRLLLQVGLKGAKIPAGSRQALNVTVVLDVRGERSNKRLAPMRKLLLTLNELRETGDRFEVLTVGTSEKTLVSAKNFLHGYLSIAFDQLAQRQEPAGSVPELIPVLDTAVHALAPGENDASPYGGSLLLFVTDRPLEEQSEQLEQLAYQSAAAGVPISVIGVGSRVDGEKLERIALAGQGSRWLVEGKEDVLPLLKRELTAAGRAVARAVRLNIRLAPGVQLIDVIGSKSLNDTQQSAVKNVERAIDRRLAKSLGITADRGDDEDGIQLVIPAYYAGDDHVILLDLVASGPGKIAEVTARYKDLVFLRNGVARTELTIGASKQLPGPLEENVLKNYLAFQLAAVLQYAGEQIDTGDQANAIAALESYRRLLLAFRERHAGFTRDSGIEADVSLLNGYLQLLKTIPSQPLSYSPDDIAKQVTDNGIIRETVETLRNSLELAGKRKLTPGPSATEKR